MPIIIDEDKMAENNNELIKAEIKKCFEKSIIDTFRYFYECSKETESVFNSEHDTQAFIFMKMFTSLKDKNILYNKDGKLIIGLERQIQKFLNPEKTLNLLINNLELAAYICSFFSENVSEIKKKIRNEPGLNDDVIKLLGKVIESISEKRRIDIGITEPNETFYHENDKYDEFMGPKKYLIACEIKDSSAGDKHYFKFIPILKDIINLNLLKDCGACDEAYMIFLDTIPFEDLKKNGRKELFYVENGKLKLEINKNLSHLLEKIKFYYLYIPKDVEVSELTEENIYEKTTGNFTLFSLKNIMND